VYTFAIYILSRWHIYIELLLYPWLFFSFHSLRARFDVQRALPSHAQLGNANLVRQNEPDCLFWVGKTTHTHGPLYSSSIRPSQQDSLLYTQFSRTHPSSISSSIHSIHCGTHLSLYLNIFMHDLVLKDLLRRI
jgi:hypothetical protein